MDESTLIDIPIVAASHRERKKSHIFKRTRRVFHPQTPEEAARLYACSGWVIWSLVAVSCAVVNLLVVPPLPFARRLVHWTSSLLCIYQIYANWRQTRRKLPIFADGIWFDAPPRGWDFCSVCHQHRPPRSYHCALCDCCVLKRNHHCHFTGVCIGLGNQRNFVLFLFWIVIGCSYAIAMSFHLLSKYYMPFTFTISGVVGYAFAPFYIFMPALGYASWSGCFLMYLEFALLVAILVAGSLLVSHVRLVLANQTEYERRRGDSSFSRGALFNFKLVFGPYPTVACLALFCPRINVRSRELDCIYGRPQYTKIM